MSDSSFSPEGKKAAINYFKGIISKFLLAPSRSKEYSPDFYSLTKDIQKESEKNVDMIAEMAATLWVEEIDRLRSNNKNISGKVSEKGFKKSIEKAYKEFKRIRK